MDKQVFENFEDKRVAYLDAANGWIKTLGEYEQSVAALERRIATEKVQDAERLAELDKLLERELPRNTRAAYLAETEEIAGHTYTITEAERKEVWVHEGAAHDAESSVVSARDALLAAFDTVISEITAEKNAVLNDSRLQQLPMINARERIKQRFYKL